MTINIEYVIRAAERLKIPAYIIGANTFYFNSKVFTIKGGILSCESTRMRFFNIKGLFENLLEHTQSWSMANIRSLVFFYESQNRDTVRNSREAQAHESWVKKNYKPNEFSEKR